ncbi:hypothetical protein HPC49_52320, partial [Pyxidicoccus fallax]|nr:hypothetical protein [Pyxidicoccus fallax]NPC86759.1 hypothetical protein [Pyxidicoccus fallax]
PQPVAVAPRAPAEADPGYEDEDPASPASESLAESLTESPDNAPRKKPSGWMRRTGIYASIGGAVALGAGGIFGLRSRSLNDDLSRRYTDGLLVPGDRAKFNQVKTSNTLANTLMIGGGVIALTGLTFWGLSAVSFDSDGEGGGNVNVRGQW